MKRQTRSEKNPKSPTANNHMGNERRNSNIFRTDGESAEWTPWDGRTVLHSLRLSSTTRFGKIQAGALLNSKRKKSISYTDYFKRIKKIIITFTRATSGPFICFCSHIRYLRKHEKNTIWATRSLSQIRALFLPALQFSNNANCNEKLIRFKDNIHTKKYRVRLEAKANLMSYNLKSHVRCIIFLN